MKQYVYYYYYYYIVALYFLSPKYNGKRQLVMILFFSFEYKLPEY